VASVSVDRTVASLGFGRSFSSPRISLDCGRGGGGGTIHGGGGGDWSLVRFRRAIGREEEETMEGRRLGWGRPVAVP